MKILLVVLVLLKLCKSKDFSNEKLQLNGVYHPRLSRGYAGIKKVQNRESNFWPVEKESRCKFVQIELLFWCIQVGLERIIDIIFFVQI